MFRLRHSRVVPRLLWLATWFAAGVSRTVAGRVAATLWFVPWQRPPRPEGDAPGRRIVVEASGHRLHGFEAGDGPTVLLVHGWADTARALDGFVAPLVATGHRVVAVDLPAHGASPGVHTNGFELAKVIRTLIDQFAVQAVVAHSLGALATSLAVRDGARVRAVVLISPATQLEQALERFAVRSRLPRRAIAGLEAEMTRRFGAGVWNELVLGRHEATLALPALLVHDRGDRQTLAADTRRLAEQWRRARLVETEGLGHRRLLADADVIDRVTDFVTTAVSSIAAVEPRSIS